MHKLRAVLRHVGALHMQDFQAWDGTQEPVSFLTREQCKAVLEHQFDSTTKFSTETAADAIEDQLRSQGRGGGEDVQAVNIDVDNVSVHELRERTAELVESLYDTETVPVAPVTWNGETGNDDRFLLQLRGPPDACVSCAGEAEKQAIEYAGFLFKMYEVQYWWFEMCEMLR